MADLPKGFSIKTKNLMKAVVEEKLGEGGQGAVYQSGDRKKQQPYRWEQSP
jgi:hypothetical protein